MADARQDTWVDYDEIRFRAESIEAGIKLALVICAAGLAYVAATWDQPNRELIGILFGIGAVLTLPFMLMTHERVTHSRFREVFFLGWSVSNIGLAASVSYLDGGSTSPLALLFFIPLIFASLAYPLASVVAVGVLDYLAYVFVGVAAGEADAAHVGFFALCLAATAVLCGWHASNQDRRRRVLAHVSRADPLTGCLNRRGLEERLDAELSVAARTGRPLAFVMLDLDHFKETNDTQGHAAGDDLLCWAVETMQAVLRPSDTVGRIGGDEFAVIAPGAGPSDGKAVAERIGKVLAERAPASVGMACFPSDGTDREELHGHADGDLYAGRRGRSMVPKLTGKELSWATALAAAVDERMAVKHEQSRQVANHSVAIAERLGWPHEQLELLQLASILHDVGKVSVPDHILQKQEPLTDGEWAEIRKHPITGAEMVYRIEGLEPIVPWIRHSHEHFDGSGYPDGLSGEAIPLACRILHVAVAFTAMTSERTYRRALSRDEALAELLTNAGSQFDPDCVAIFEHHLSEVTEAAEAV
jgi:diguanylate cyclase (GGDEF)-like protein